jgi:tetratricopeptide (TPR) repeat protein
MKNKKPTILLAFANDKKDYLNNISTERKAIYDLTRDYIHTEKIENTSVDSLIDECRKQENIVILHYGGHAGSDYLLFETAKGTTEANINNLIQIIQQQPNLQLVFLNGCTTHGQVDVLLKAGIKAVIATNIRINDRTALAFSTRFYKSLTKGETLEKAFEDAENLICTEHDFDKSNIGKKRGFVFENDQLNIKFPWGLFYDDETVLDWKLPKRRDKNIIEILPNELSFEVFGRAEHLKEIYQKFSVQQKPLAITGIGGLGKSTVANLFIHQYKANFYHRIWLDVNSSIQNTFVTNLPLLIQLNLFEIINKLSAEEKQTHGFNLVINALKALEGNNNILILDNVESDANLYAVGNRLNDLLPNWKIIVTTREFLAEELYERYDLDLLSEEKAIDLYKKHRENGQKKDTEENIKSLLSIITPHPLLIELIAKTIKEADISIPIFQEYLENKQLDDDELDAVNDISYKEDLNLHQIIVKTFYFIQDGDFQEDKLKLQKEQLYFLKQFAVMPPFAFDRKHLQFLLQIPTQLHANFQKELQKLYRLGWLSYNKNGQQYTMHRTIQTVMRTVAPIPNYEDCDTLLQSLSKIYKENDLFYFADFIPKRLAIYLTDDNADYLEQLLKRYITQHQYLLGEILISVIQHTEDIDESKYFELHYNAAEYLKAKGRFDESVQQFINYVCVIINQGNTSPEFGFEAFEFIMEIILHQKQDLKAAESWLNSYETYLKENTNYDNNNNKKRQFLTHKGSYFRLKGDYKQAAKIFELALDLSENQIIKNEKTIAIHQSNLATVYQNLGRYEAAANLLEIALQSARNNFGENHPTVATRQSNLAIVYRNLGRYEAAANLLEIALKSDLNNFGENHPEVAKKQSNLATVYRNLGRYEAAANLLEIALQSAKNNFGENHPTVAKKQSNLANVYGDLGRYEAAANLLEIALQSDLNNFGENHPEVAKKQSNLAIVYQNLGRYEEAANLLEIALKSDLNNFGENHPEVAKKQSNLAAVYRNLGRYEEAATLLEIALQSALNNFGENHPTVATRQSNLANVYGDLGRYEAAATLLEIALQSDLNNFGENHPEVAKKQSNLAIVYQNLGRYEEAATLLEIALQSDLNNFGENHPTVATSLNNLAGVYFSIKEYQKAKDAWIKTLDILKLNYGEHPYIDIVNRQLQMVEKEL